MGPETKGKYLQALDRHINASSGSLDQVIEARNTAEGAMQSRYAKDMKESYARDAESRERALVLARKLRDLVAAAGPQNSIDYGADFTFVFDGDEEEERAVYSPEGARIGDIQFISDKSPIGASIRGLESGDAFKYSVDQSGTKRSISGKIIRVE